MAGAAGPDRAIWAIGADPVWVAWRGPLAERGFALCPGSAPPAGVVAALVTPWALPGPDAVQAALTALGAAACGRTWPADVWLLCTNAPPALGRAVLAAGGAGCLARIPEPADLARIALLAAWRPAWTSPVGPAPLPDSPEGDRVAARPGSGAARPGRGASNSGVQAALRATGAAARRALARRATDRSPRQRRGDEPWWAWPAAAGPGCLVVAAASADLAPAAGAARDRWTERRGLDGTVACSLGWLPLPALGTVHPRLIQAAGARAVAVVSGGGAAALAATAAVVSALRAQGSPDIRVWLLADLPRQALRDLSLALGAPCAVVAAAEAGGSTSG